MSLVHAGVLSLVLETTHGRRAAFVGNRMDRALCSALRSTFQLAVVDMFECGLRVNGLVLAVRARSYDLVLGATGFFGHATDEKMHRACKSSGTRYVRVNRGRVGTCLVALARELGIHAGGGSSVTLVTR